MLSFTTLLLRITIILVIVLLIDLYAYQGIKAATSRLADGWRNGIRVGYWAVTGLFVLSLLVTIGIAFFGRNFNSQFGSFMFGLVVLVYLPKMVLMLLLLGEDAYRVLRAMAAKAFELFEGGVKQTAQDPAYFIPRSAFLSQVGLALAAIPFAGVAYGLARGGYQFTVHRKTLVFKNLPKAFDGFKIVQISDIHSGSFTRRAEVQRGIGMVNNLGADVILFTGDIVNNRADELDPWMDVFNQLRAPHGVFSILGNHDYGDYVRWETAQDKAANLAELKTRHKTLGFDLLLNNHRLLEKDGQSIGLIGVENWGLPPFPQYGNLKRATDGLPDVPFKILLSHDPSHWDAEVLGHSHHFDLTLSGHTHGMQFGVEIPGFRWSPVQYRYPRWAGLYQEGEKYLYVNRGFGFIGLPGRVGIWPEITLITLQSA